MSSIIKSYFCQLRDFRRIPPIISKTAAITLANLLTHSRLDYCKSYFMVSPITPSIVCKKFKMQLIALLFLVSVHHTSLRFLNLCIDYLLTTVLILRFVASLIVSCLYTNLIILVLSSAYDQIFIPFVFSI